MSEIVLTEESVIHFLNGFEAIAEEENFDLIQDMIHDKAYFRFNDGDFVGKQAVRAAFEKTWKGSANVKKERFYLTEHSGIATIGKATWMGSPSAFKGEELACSSPRTVGCRSSTNTLAGTPSSDA